MLDDRTHIYCPNCKAIRPAVPIEMNGRDVTGTYEGAVDFLCDHCKYIVATFYREPASVARPA